MSKTKIICTLGPVSESKETIRRLIESGMNVARLNFSHGSHESHANTIRIIRSIAVDCGRPVAILQDLQGPKIRVGEIPDPGIKLKTGESLVLTNRSISQPSSQGVPVSYRDLPRDVDTGDRILLADGMMEVEVVRSGLTDIVTRVITGGILTSNKGINLPTRSVKTEAFTEKDQRDLAFGLQADVDFVALSFVRKASDIETVKSKIREAGKDTPVIAKIEKHEAIENLAEILDAADGIMVARGDLGVEIPPEKVPQIQKRIVRESNSRGKPVIIATQMLRSMVEAPRPTRAEAADVANGVLDGADAVMLSEETAVGKYPVEAVLYMKRIIESAEEQYPHGKYLNQSVQDGVSASVAYAAVVLADRLNATCIIATTRSGFTAEMISRYRPKSRILALCPEEHIVRRMELYWGCMPCLQGMTGDTDQLIEDAAVSALATGFVQSGDLAVITGGRPIWERGTTNMLWVKAL